MTLVLQWALRALRIRWEALLAPAADPREAFAGAYGGHEQLVRKIHRALEELRACRRRLETRTVKLREKLPAFEQQARGALRDGRVDLARRALQRRRLAERELQALERQVRGLQGEEDRISLVEQRLAAQLAAARAREEIVAARYSAAEAQVRITESLAGVSTDMAGLGVVLERAEQMAEDMQARASALDRLVTTGVLEISELAPDTIEEDLARSEADLEVEKRLEVLRQEQADPRAADQGAGP